MSAPIACPECLRRARLLAELAGRIEIARAGRRPVRDVLALGEEELIAALAGDDAAGVRARVARMGSPAALAEEARVAGLRVLCRHDLRYPAALLDDRSAPAAVFVAGDVDRFAALVGEGAPVVSIVGSRRASDEALMVARTLGRGLAAAGVTVVSGLALGIDSAAHEGALEGGGTTVAVLGGGADVPYPTRKRRVYDRIVSSGAVISEMPPGFRAFKWSFPARNRIIAGLARATIVVEAAERSGSLITAELALDLGRDVGAVPGSVLSWRSRGTNALLRDGATLIRDAQDALDLALGADGARLAADLAARTPAPPPADLAPDLLALLAAVEDGRDTVDALSPDPAGAALVHAGLMELELHGLVRRAPGGRIVRTTAA